MAEQRYHQGFLYATVKSQDLWKKDQANYELIQALKHH